MSGVKTTGYLLGVVLLLTEPPAAQKSSSGPPAGVVLGSVIDGTNGSPVGGAVVEIAPSAATVSPANRRTVIANADGRFVLWGLQGGQYRISASYPGYLAQPYAQRGQAAGEAIAVPAGPQPLRITLRLWSASNLNGVVLDDLGEPAVGVKVHALQRTMTARGLQLVAVAVVETDDRGTYRIAPLSAGDYIVAVPSSVTSVPVSSVDWYRQSIASGRSPREMSRVLGESGAPTPASTGMLVARHFLLTPSGVKANDPTISSSGAVMISPTLFYSDAHSLDGAHPITLAPGQQEVAVNFRLAREPSVSVTGVVIGPNGPVPHVGLQMFPATRLTRERFECARTLTDAGGRFTMLGIAPGEHVIEVSWIPEGSEVLLGREAISIQGRDITDVQVVLQPAVSLAGRIETGPSPKDSPAPDWGQIRVSLVPVDDDVEYSVRVSADGSFRINGIAGKRYFVTATAPNPWILDDVMVDARNVMDAGITLAESGSPTVVLHLTPDAGEIAGVVDDAFVARLGARIVVIPAAYDRWVQGGRAPFRSAIGTADTAGSFRISGVIPGEYFVAAVSPEVVIDMRDQRALGRLARVATPIEIRRAARAYLRLRVASVR